MTDSLPRCPWCGTEPIYVKYHDEEWGCPQHEESRLYEKLVLEAAQAGLSWITILKKRDNYREAFDHFDVQKVARYDEAKIAELLQNPGIIRNRQKIVASISNAQRFIEVQAEFGSFDVYLWRFVDGKQIHNARQSIKDIPAVTPEAEALSQDLKKRGFKFVGATICYAYMQSLGLVNDHLVTCFRYAEIAP